MPPKKTANKGTKKTAGLNKKEKTEVALIAKNAVKTVAEKKWFNVKSIPGAHPTLATGGYLVSGIGYSTTEDTSDTGVPVLWCGQNVKEMLCLRPWALNTVGADTERKALAMEGKFLQPVSSKSRFRISRQFAKIDPTYNVTPPDFPAKLAENCPIICRMMRVTPKIAAGTTTEIAPDSDLFLNEYGEALGPNELGFNEREMLFYKINKRRYQVLEDIKFKVESPVTLQYQSIFRADTQTTDRYTPIVQTNANAKCERYVTMYHQLSKVKGGKCYYEDPLAETPPSNATTGNRREYVFMLFAYQGADSITGEGASLSQGPTSNLLVEHVNYSKFIDV